MRIVGYARVSTSRQAAGTSVEAQEEAIRKWAERRGHKVVGVYRDDGKPGRLEDANRPGLLEALNIVEVGDAEALVVHRLERLARPPHVQEAVLARVWSVDGQVWEVTGDMGVLGDDSDDPYRSFVRQVTGAARELERNMIIARMQAGRKRKAGQKGHTGGRVPYGFERRGEGKAAVLVEVPAEQAVIKRMMRMRRRGRTLRQIATKLNADGVPARDGGEWQHTSVRSLLRRAAA